MIKIANYNIQERLNNCSTVAVYRGIRTSDKIPVVIKTINSTYPQHRDLNRLMHEYEILRDLDIPGVIKAYGLEKRNKNLALILEDFHGANLKSYFISNPFNLNTFLSITTQLSNILGDIHGRNIIHKDINPGNILYNPKTDEVKIIDFALATLIPREEQRSTHPDLLRGTLAYISPEQTGRMNRSLDYRTDFYSLGVSCYEMLTGNVPFEESDPLELVYCHIAKTPVSPHDLNGNVPKVVSEIVMKLLSKNAEDRYQSAYGLRRALEQCSDYVDDTNAIKEFAIDQYDVSEKLFIPEKLYGRDSEISKLMAGFDRVSNGSSELLLVSGFSGLGKSSLVNEVQKPIVRQKGFFISGKADQYKRIIPYSAITSAFQVLIRQLLTKSNKHLNHWKETILSALGPNGNIIIEIIPELERIIGKQPPIVDVKPQAAENRFRLVFQEFVAVFTTQEHPLVIFLDDLQWIDQASLNLLKILLTSQNSSYLFVIGAYRDNEIDSTHPLTLTINEIQKSNTQINTLTLFPLKIQQINQLVSDTFSCSEEKTLPLSELLEEKTAGNPFFVNQLLKSIYEEHLIEYCKLSGSWQWNIELIRGKGVMDNVVELMAGKILKFSEEAQQVIRMASCIGSQFDLKTLSLVNKKQEDEVAVILFEFIKEGLIVPTYSSKFTILDFKRNPDSHIHDARVYKFIHNRIQQAAYTLIPDDKKKEARLMIGRILLRNTPQEEKDEIIFDLVDHLNTGAELITDESEIIELAYLNLLAGKKAKNSTAYNDALKLVTTGMQLLPENRWINHYKLTLSLYVTGAYTAYLCCEYSQMEELNHEVLKNTDQLLDRVKVYKIHMLSSIAQYKLEDAVHTALNTLEQLGVRVPRKPNKRQLYLEIIKTRTLLIGKTVEGIENMPQMKDKKKLAVMDFVESTVSTLYHASAEVLAILIYKMVRLSIKHGNSPLSPMLYSLYGSCVYRYEGRIDIGYQFCSLSLKLIDKFQYRENESKTLTVFNVLIKHWKKHLVETHESLKKGCTMGVQTGDLEYAGRAAAGYCYHLILSGCELRTVEQELAKYQKIVIKQINSEEVLQRIKLSRQYASDLVSRDPNTCLFSGEFFNEREIIPILEKGKIKDKRGIVVFYIHKSVLSYLFGDFSLSLESVMKANRLAEVLWGEYILTRLNFYHSLVLLALYPEAKRQDQREYLKTIASNQKKMKKWAHNAPMNHLHKYYLVEAEAARVKGYDKRAINFYDKAIAQARDNNYLNNEALANELASRFYTCRDNKRDAIYHMREAHYCYYRWGAHAKVKDLEKRHPQLLKTYLVEEQSSRHQQPSTTFNREYALSALDLKTVMKTSLAISSEIVLKKLLARFMKIVMENAGATKGFLIMKKSGRLVIEVEGVLGDEDAQILKTIPLHTYKDKLPLSIVQYTRRTLESILSEDAFNNELFALDPYMIKTNLESLLCIPIVNQGRLLGILYLENNQAKGVFNTARIDLLQVLSSQMAISIENARLYSSLQESEKKYRAIFEDTKDVLFVTTTDGQIIDVNPAAEKMTGYTHHELLQLKAQDLYHITAGRQHFQEAMSQHGSVRGFELKSRRKDGKIIEITVTATARYALDGTIIGYQGIIRDITFQKEAERERLKSIGLQKAKEAAEDANQAKSAFISNISHEIRTPLNSVLGLMELALKTNDNTKQKEYLEMGKTSGQALLNLTSDVIDISKIEAGKWEMDNVDFHLRDVVEKCIVTMSFEAKRKGLQFHVSIAPEIPERLHGDSQCLTQILTNIIGNAVKFTEKGEIVLTIIQEASDTVDDSIQSGVQGSALLHFMVKDTGIGIPEEKHDKILEDFTQADSSMTRKYGGTGLGTTISKKLVELMGGEIWFESYPGRGSTFHFTTKFCYQEEEEEEEVTPVMDEIPPLNILLAEDNELNQMIIRDLLNAKGHEVTIAEDGSKAVDLWQKGDYDLILMDLKMPEMNGCEASEKIRKIEKGNGGHIPIIAVTANVIKEELNKCLIAGMDDYITKAIDSQELMRKIKNLIS